jgi:hypothetical protein
VRRFGAAALGCLLVDVAGGARPAFGSVGNGGGGRRRSHTAIEVCVGNSSGRWTRIPWRQVNSTIICTSSDSAIPALRREGRMPSNCRVDTAGFTIVSDFQVIK